MPDLEQDPPLPLEIVHSMAAQKCLRIFEVRVSSVSELGEVLKAAEQYGFSAKYDESTGMVRLHRLDIPRS